MQSELQVIRWYLNESVNGARHLMMMNISGSLWKVSVLSLAYMSEIVSSGELFFVPLIYYFYPIIKHKLFYILKCSAHFDFRVFLLFHANIMPQ